MKKVPLFPYPQPMIDLSMKWWCYLLLPHVYIIGNLIIIKHYRKYIMDLKVHYGESKRIKDSFYSSL